MKIACKHFLCLIVCFALSGIAASAQQVTSDFGTPKSPPIEEIGEDVYRVGRIRVDLSHREATVDGVVNDVSVLEFVATTKGGFKSYESAIEMDTDAISFNLAMLLLGLDKSRAVLSRYHFDPEPPQGDPVEIWIEWEDGGKTRRVRGERLIYNATSKKTLPETPWVYTGSVFMPDGSYLAERDGVLIGVVHTPAPIIENPLPDGVGDYGAWVLNPTLGLPPGTAIKVTVKALAR
jgi:hypothetical protein